MPETSVYPGHPDWQQHFDRRKKSFDSKYVPNARSGCWDWMAAKNEHGVGIFKMNPFWRNAKPAPIAAWFFYRNHSMDLNAKLSYHHLCPNPSCVNPDHIGFAGDTVEGVIEMLRVAALKNPDIKKQIDAAIAILGSTPSFESAVTDVQRTQRKPKHKERHVLGGMYIDTERMLQLIHDGFEAAEHYDRTDIADQSESLLSMLTVVMRHRLGYIYKQAGDNYEELEDKLRKLHKKNKSRSETKTLT